METMKEFDIKRYRTFYSMQELVTAISRTMKVMSWGSHAWTMMNKALLRFRVQAHRHKGHVYIAVNGADLFEIWLTTLQGNIKKHFSDVYLEDLIDTIDQEIEAIPEYKQ